MSELMTSVYVSYKFVDGWHVFSSDAIAGLYVASKDGERAYNDVPKSIELLLKFNEGIECIVKPEHSYMEFLRCVRELQALPDKPKVKSKPHPPSTHGLSGRLFAVYPAHAFA